MVVTRHDEVASRVRLLRSHGMTTLTWDRHRGHASSYDVTMNGFNYRLNEIAAALGRCQLKKLVRGNRKRKELAHTYHQALFSAPNLTIPFAGYSGDSAHHLMTAVAPDGDTRDLLAQSLATNGIQTSRHYPCVPTLSALRKYDVGAVPRSTHFAQRVITLPLFPSMTVSEAQDVCRYVRESLSP